MVRFYTHRIDMEENFEEIVRKYYHRLREPFIRRLTQKYPSLRLERAEDLYQDTFLAVQENIQKGNVMLNTDWDAYILKIGFNMASKDLRYSGITDTFSPTEDPDGDTANGNLANKVDSILKEMPEEDEALCNNPEVLSNLGNELSHTPEPCAKIIKLFYYSNVSMKEIAEETGLKNAQTAKSKKNQCMSDLIHRVTEALRRAGYNITPKKRNNNGKN